MHDFQDREDDRFFEGLERRQRSITEENDDDDEKTKFLKKELKSQEKETSYWKNLVLNGIWQWRNWPFFLFGLLTFLMILMGVAGFGMSIWDTKKIEQLDSQCSATRVDNFALSRRYADSERTDWRSFSRDLQSSAHNPHLSSVGGDTIKRVMGACAAGATEFLVSGTIGVSATITMDSDTNMLFVADNGVSSTPTAIAARLYGVTIDPAGGCTITWTKTVQSLGVQTSTVAVPVKGNDATVGFSNPMAKIGTALAVTRNETGGLILVFGDTGTGAYYNWSTCNSSFPNPCGARVYGIEATTGELIWRSLVTESVATVTGYLRQSDRVGGAAKVWGSYAWFGMSTNQSYDVITTNRIDFYARYFAVDINSGAIMFNSPVNSAAQIAAGNYGAAITSTPVVDPFHDLVIYGTSHLLNQSLTVYSCLVAGYSRKYCLGDGINSNQLFAVIGVPTIPPVTTAVWRDSPYGVDAFNQDCLKTPVGPNCPGNYGPSFGYNTAPILIANECGQTYTIAIGNSGTLYAVEAGTSGGTPLWTTYIGPAGDNNTDNGISFDGKNVYFAVSNTNKKSYLTLDGTLRCDSFWASVNAWTGKINWIEPTPCSRASSECPAIVADPWLLASGAFTAETLTFADRIHGTVKSGAAVTCFGTISEDVRNTPYIGSVAIGPVVTTTNLVFGGSFSGHMHVLSSHDGHLITSLSRCTTGIVYGGASVGVMQGGEKLVTYGCGLGTGIYPSNYGSTEVKVLRIP